MGLGKGGIICESYIAQNEIGKSEVHSEIDEDHKVQFEDHEVDEDQFEKSKAARIDLSLNLIFVKSLAQKARVAQWQSRGLISLWSQVQILPLARLLSFKLSISNLLSDQSHRQGDLEKSDKEEVDDDD